jgi:hypothetical protein
MRKYFPSVIATIKIDYLPIFAKKIMARMDKPDFLAIVFLSALYLWTSPTFAQDQGKYLAESEMGASIQKLREEFELLEATRKEKQSLWQARVALPSPENECIAYLRKNGACLLTAGEFNLNLNPDDSVSLLDSTSQKSKSDLLNVRKKILEGFSAILHGRAMLQDTNDAGIRKDADKAWRVALAEEEKAAKAAKLDGLYRRYYDAYFAPRQRIDLELMGASDSVFLDSLVASLKNAPLQAPADARYPEGSGARGKGPLFLWETPVWEDLPPEISGPLQGLLPERYSPLIRTPYGWFAARILERTPIPAISREQALPLLLSLASIRPEFLQSLENPPEAAPAEGAENPDPDIRCWLLPASRLPGRSSSLPKWADTARVKPMDFRMSLLPDPVYREFSGIVSRYGYGIRKTRFGVWYLRTLRNQPGAEKPADATWQRMLKTRREAAMLRGLHLAALETATGREREFKLGFLQNRKSEGTLPNALAGAEKNWVYANVDFVESALKP